MLSGLTTLLTTTAGKVALGTAVTVAGVGGAQSTGLVDLPVLPAAVDDTTPDAGDAPVDTTGADTTITSELAPTPTEPDTTIPVPPEPEPTTPDTGQPPATDQSHGEEVSTVAHDSDLDGCEHGQAVAAVASSKSQGRSPDHDGARCPDHDDDDPDQPDLDEPDDSDDPDDGGDTDDEQGSDDDDHDDDHGGSSGPGRSGGGDDNDGDNDSGGGRGSDQGSGSDR